MRIHISPFPPDSGSGSVPQAKSSSSKSTSSERHDARKKKKNFYANLKRQEDNKLAELSEKYRDRARERRDGDNPDYQPSDATGSSNAYRAVAPDLKSGLDAAERRRQMIQESKFLGGDMQHTHLVKGLDYALLQKVRSEIVVKEQEEELEMERLADEGHDDEAEESDEGEEEEDSKFKTILGRNVFNIVQAHRSKKIERNELFAPGRMAFVIDLEEENGETDIPTTLIRSKADLPAEAQEVQTLSTNDIVINKLSQILSYLRQGGKGKKNKKRDKDKPLFKEPELPLAARNHHHTSSNAKSSSSAPKKPAPGDSIYDDIGEYRPSTSSSRRRDQSGDGSGSSSKYKYFDKNEEADREAGVMTGE